MCCMSYNFKTEIQKYKKRYWIQYTRSMQYNISNTKSSTPGLYSTIFADTRSSTPGPYSTILADTGSSTPGLYSTILADTGSSTPGLYSTIFII